MKNIFKILLLTALLLTNSSLAFAIPVVPGAFGFGMNTRAAYGCGVDPVILRVTSLSDSGTGTLRAALIDSRPRVIVFERSGYIDLQTTIFVASPCVTIAGQTAPNPGITIRAVGDHSYDFDNGLIDFNTHDVLLQHVALRGGASTCNSVLRGYGGSQANLVFDHISVSWGLDEGIGFSSTFAATTEATVWRSIIAEGLWATQLPNASAECFGGDPSGADGHGILINTGAKNISIIQNLFAESNERNPAVSDGATAYISNNINYNNLEGILSGNANNSGLPSEASVIGNYFKRGTTANQPTEPFAIAMRGVAAGSHWYLSDNTIDNGGYTPAILPFYIINNEGIDPRVSSPTITVPGYTPMSSSAAYASDLVNAGARPANRDAVDTRIVADVINRTGHAITQESDVGGFPTLAVNTRSFVAPSSPNSISSSGYTNLEDTLHAAALAVEGSGGGTYPTPAYTTPYTTPASSSPSGTRLTTTSGTIIDNSGNTWSLGTGTSPNIVILLNGSQAAGGLGSQILWYNGLIYVKGDDNNWYSWTGSNYSNSLGATDPNPVVASPSGTRVPPAASIVDVSGNTWTIGSGNLILKNAVQAGSGVGSKLLYYQNNIYTFSTDNNWWLWNGTNWTSVGANDPTGAIVGDLTFDRIINSLDWSYMNAKWGSADVIADLDHNGMVNSLDFGLMNGNWFKVW